MAGSRRRETGPPEACATFTTLRLMLSLREVVAKCVTCELRLTAGVESFPVRA